MRIIVGGYLLPLIHRDDHLIAEPVTEEIHAAGENERDQRALPSAHEISSPNEQSGKNGQKNGGSKGIHILSSLAKTSYVIGKGCQDHYRTRRICVRSA